MAFDPIRLAPVIPAETPTTDNSVVDLSGSGLPAEADSSLAMVNEVGDLDRDKITDWFQKINDSLKYRRDHWNGINSWLRFKKLYAGYHFGNWRKSPSMITVNTAYAVIRNLIPDMYFKDPYIYVNAGRDGDEFSASVTEHVVNQHWTKQMKGKRAVRRVILDYGIFGWGLGKTGYRFLTDVAKNTIEHGEIDFERYHELEQVYHSRVSVFNFLWDFISASHPEDSEWVAELTIRPQDDVIADARFKNVEFIKSSAIPKLGITSFSAEGGTQYFGSFLDTGNTVTSRNFVFVWIIHDRKHNKIIHLAEGMEDRGLRMTEIPFGFVPYDYMIIDEIPDEPFPISPIGAIEDQIIERDRIRTRQFNHWKRFGRKWKYLKGKVDANDLVKLRRGDDGVTIGVKSMDDIAPMTDTPLTRDVLIAEGAARSDIIEIVGVQRGTPNSSKQSATKDRRDSVIDDRRTIDRRSLVADYMVDVATKIIKIMRAEFNFPRIVKISGGTLGQYWVSFTKDDIVKLADVNVDVAEFQPEDPALLRKQMMDLYVILRGDPNINGRELLRRALKQFPGMRDTDALFMPQTLFDNPIFKLIQQQANGTRTEGGMNPSELLRLFRTIMSNQNLTQGFPDIAGDPNQQALQSRTAGNFIKQPPVRPNAVEGNVANLRNRGINP